MTNSDAIKVAEYESLRQEITQNKKYVFERPLFLIGATGLAASQLTNNPIALLLPALLVSLLLVNLWFTVNRLRSTARIVAYIGLIIESEHDNWMGWENSLRKYREWIKGEFKEDKAEFIEAIDGKVRKTDAMWYYHILLWLHLIPVIVGTIASIFYAYLKFETLEIIGLCLTLPLSFIFFFACIKPFHPKHMGKLIATQRQIWKKVQNVDKAI